MLVSTYWVRIIFYLSAFCPFLPVDLAILNFLSSGYYNLSDFKSNALWGGTVFKNDGTHRTPRTVPTVPPVPYPPYPPYRTHRKCHMYLPVLNHQKTCFSFLLKLDNFYYFLQKRHFQYYFLLQSFHKVPPSTTLYCNACTKYFPVLLGTTKLAQGTSQ